MHFAHRCGIYAVVSVALSAAAAAEQVPDSLAPPAGLRPVLAASAEGVQVYRCKTKGNVMDVSEGAWIFEAPRATLTDQQGHAVGRHYAGPTWEATDGSKITGKVAATAKATEAGAIAWLLLKTESAGLPGRLDEVRAVQRVFTSGGSAPAGSCPRIDDLLEVPYRATYVFWAP